MLQVMNAENMKLCVRLLTALGLLSHPWLSQAQELSGGALVKALRQGGLVLVMRHASSPRDVPGGPAANADNLKRERQLDEKGRASAAAMGKALRALKIPVGDVYTSPAYRAIETARLAELPNPKIKSELGDGGQSMQGVTEAQSAWLQKRVGERARGGNSIFVTHMPNMTAAFPRWSAGLADGETLVFGSDGKTGTTAVARIKIEEWPGLAAL